jgi:hypothetical protein
MFAMKIPAITTRQAGFNHPPGRKPNWLFGPGGCLKCGQLGELTAEVTLPELHRAVSWRG